MQNFDARENLMDDTYFSAQDLAVACRGRWISDTAQGLCVSSISTDSRADCTGSIFFAVKGENFDGHDFVDAAMSNGASAVCIGEANVQRFAGLRVPVLMVPDVLKAYQDIAFFHRMRMQDLIVVGITGSSGKTSTKEILKTLFVKAFGESSVYATEGNTNNHVGVPRNLLKLNRHHRFAVIEMGSNHSGEIEVLTMIARPNLAIISSVGSSHLEFFDTVENVAREKGAIFKGLMPSKMNNALPVAVIPADSAHLKILADFAGGSRKLTFGSAGDVDMKIVFIRSGLDGSEFILEWKNGTREKVKWPVPGRHQAANAAGAALVASSVGISPDKIAESLPECRLPGMRSRAKVSNGITWINDAYNANPDSMRAAIDWLADSMSEKKIPADSGTTVVVLGDMFELGENTPRLHRDVLEYAISRLGTIATIIVVGGHMVDAFRSLEGKPAGVKCLQSQAECVSLLKNILKPGDIVFLKASRGMKLETVENSF